MEYVLMEWTAFLVLVRQATRELFVEPVSRNLELNIQHYSTLQDPKAIRISLGHNNSHDSWIVFIVSGNCMARFCVRFVNYITHFDLFVPQTLQKDIWHIKKPPTKLELKSATDNDIRETHWRCLLNYFQISTNAVRIRAKTTEYVLMAWTDFRVPVLQVTMESIVKTVSLI